MAKRSFILYNEYEEYFSALGDKECGKLIKAILHYENTGEEISLPHEAHLIFMVVRNALRENRSKYEDICKKRSEAGRKGGRASALSKSSKCLTLQANASDTDTETDTDTGTDTGTETETDTVVNMCSENKQENTPTPQKTARGEFQNVFLTAEEMARLILDYGVDTANDAVNLLSTRIARDDNSRYKNENHYATIKSWVITALEEHKQRQKELSRKQKPEETKSCHNPSYDGIELEDFLELPYGDNKTPES